MTRKNRAMLIGSIGAGKSTLTNALLGKEARAVKTQALIYYDWIVDTPGEYTENPLFYKNIMATSLEVSHVLFLQDATKQKNIFPPGFSQGINKLPIGVVTKSDASGADVSRAIKQLKTVVTRGPLIISSSIRGEGIQEIRDIVKCNSLNEMKTYIEQHPSDYMIFP
ncbi:EutP/PduV family microcompartment system protein [Sutcliffiella cohnii]|uniref:EutP/PduV family microcompartment system protein n=1 Tax=Sutcliffiella cohnii TaxID=33932 RepID=UPI002E1F6BD7|nr:EutP/PduV family microcompartment system protein [Sutcliffiella cohnii]MED4017748.1 EutP/PduV family microcompartment system protein [Sutcliffiella cohnii]